MSQFRYIAKNKKGKEEKGTMESSDQRSVMEELKKRELFPVLIAPIKKKSKTSFSLLGRIFTVPLKNKMIFCRHLSVMISSGLSLSKALEILEKQEKNSTLRTIIGKMHEDVSRGVSLADAIAKYPATFDSIFVSMVKMGELSGNLEDVLSLLSAQLENDNKLISKVKGAMIYPSVIMVAMIVIGVIMMIFVVPRITGVFSDFGAELPLSTRILLAVSDFMSENAILTLLFVFGGMAGIFYFGKTNPGKRIYHFIFLKAPIIGPVISKFNSARFSRILSSLLESGTSLIDSLRITSDTLGNFYFKKTVLKASKDVQKGVSLSDALSKNSKVFPFLVVQMIQVGEETGKTPNVLKTLADSYEDEVNQVTKNLSSVIEPILMLVIGAAVGLFAIAIIKPIYSVMEFM